MSMKHRVLLLSLLVPFVVMCDKPVEPDKPDDSGNTGQDIYAEAPAEIVNGSTILVTNEVIEHFLTNVKYTAHDYSDTAIKNRDYNGNLVSPGKYDPQPQYSIRWKKEDISQGEEVTVTVTEDGTGKKFVFTPADSETYYAVVYNFLPGASYTYKAVAESGKVLKEGSFSTRGHLHHMNFKSKVRNCRDLGGWKTTDGKTVKYRMVYRGGRIQKSTLTAAGIKMLQNEGIVAELDLRGKSDVNTWEDDGDDWGANKWIKNREDFCSPIIEEGYTQMLRDDKEKTRQCMQFIFDCVKSNKPVYFHCSLGRDRTGTVAMLTLGILGVDEGDISQEYELTQFAPSGYSVSEGEKTQMTRKVDYKSAATFIWDNYAKGGSFQQGVQAYLLEIGISQKDIDDFRAAMLL